MPCPLRNAATGFNSFVKPTGLGPARMGGMKIRLPRQSTGAGESVCSSEQSGKHPEDLVSP